MTKPRFDLWRGDICDKQSVDTATALRFLAMDPADEAQFFTAIDEAGRCEILDEASGDMLVAYLVKS